MRLNDENAVIEQSKLNPLPRDSAVNKSLSQKPNASESGHADREAVQAGHAATVQGEGGGKARRRSRDAEARKTGNGISRTKAMKLPS